MKGASTMAHHIKKDPFALTHGQFCPGCGHHMNKHAAGFCYDGDSCGWTPVGEGNAYGVPAGWLNLKEYKPERVAA